jgi:hypothetical protein
VPFVRFSRDKRGYEHTYLIHAAPRKGAPARVLYWYRTPPGVKVGRAAFDEAVRRALEDQYPNIEFDWASILSASIAPQEVEHWRERRRAEKAAKQARQAAVRDDAQDSDEALSPSEDASSSDHVEGPGGFPDSNSFQSPNGLPIEVGPGEVESLEHLGQAPSPMDAGTRTGDLVEPRPPGTVRPESPGRPDDGGPSGWRGEADREDAGADAVVRALPEATPSGDRVGVEGGAPPAGGPQSRKRRRRGGRRRGRPLGNASAPDGQEAVSPLAATPPSAPRPPESSD